MISSSDQISQWFTDRGFHLTYQSTAIRLLVHPELPGVEVRVGTVYVVVERDGREVFRSLTRAFDPNGSISKVFPGLP